jgi:Spy/CpxP family protein refolding chaperone
MLRTLVRRTAHTFAIVAALATAAPAFAGDRMPDPEHIHERAEHVFDSVDATPRQRTESWRLLEGAIDDLRAYREEGRALRDRLGSALVAPRIDRAEVRAIRADLVDLFDRATDRGVELLVGIAELFTPEQRLQMRELHRMHGGWHRQHDG